jgi:hypothetical protein
MSKDKAPLAIDFSKFTDEDLEAYEKGDMSVLSDKALEAIASYEDEFNKLSDQVKTYKEGDKNFGITTTVAGGTGALAAGLAPRTSQKLVDKLLPEDLRGGYTAPAASSVVAKPTVAPAPGSDYFSPFGAGEGAVKNATHNVDEVLKNKVAQAAIKTPGYVAPGNSLILQPSSSLPPPAAPATGSPVLPGAVKPKVGMPQMRAALQSPERMPANRLPSSIKGGAAAGFGANAIENLQQGNYGDAATSGVGSASSIAAMASNPKLARAGKLGMAATILGKGYQALQGRNPEEKAEGGLTGYAKGKAVKGGLEAAKKLFTPKPTKVVRASEALGSHEGKYLNLTQSDRMRSTGGDLGGPGFSKFQLERPEYAEAQAAWGVGNKPTASGIINVNKRYPEGKAIWSPMIGSEGQHRSNQHVYDALTDEFSRQASMGKLPPELREAMNKRLSKTSKYNALGLQDIDVANPESIKNLGNTFDRRAAISEVIGGEGVGGRKGQIFDYPGVMQEMTDPMTIGSPTHAMGTRLFTLNNEIDYRPDLHSAFPYILKGDDMGVAFNPVPKELAFPSWINMAKEFTGREPGYMEMTRGIKGRGKPHQFIDEKYLRALEDAGHKKGGHIDGYAKGKIVSAAKKLILPPAENASRTQIIGTLPTYEKAGNILRQQGASGRGIDFGAGLGEGAKALGKDFDTYEPFAKNWTPTYSNAADVPSDEYGRLTNLNVLNVVPREVRDEIVQDIGRVMQPGGMGIITTRGKDVMNAKGLAGPEPMSVITSRDTYQKGFNKDELEEYLKYMLGDNFEIGRLNLGPAGAMIKKKAEGGLACMKEGGSTPAWQRAEGKNPEGGLNAAGRASYNRETGGNLKAPQPEGGPRKKSFCARMEGMKRKNTSSATANDPDSRINKSLRKWKC